MPTIIPLVLPTKILISTRSNMRPSSVYGLPALSCDFHAMSTVKSDGGAAWELPYWLGWNRSYRLVVMCCKEVLCMMSQVYCLLSDPMVVWMLGRVLFA